MTITQIAEAAREHEDCPVCGAGTAEPCCGSRGFPEPSGAHLARIARAARDNWVTVQDLGSVITDPGWFSGTEMILGGAT